MNEERKIVQIAMAATSNEAGFDRHVSLVALTDDGAIFELDLAQRFLGWTRLPSIPSDL